MMKKQFVTISFCFVFFSLYSQCIDEEWHNTSNNSIWMSCAKTINPLTELGQSHWVLYQFDDVKSIDGIKIWNISHPDQLLAGAKSVRMDVSENGTSWNEMGTYQLEIGKPGKDYIGEELQDLESINAKYVLLTILENHGALCSGLAEIKFNLGNTTVATEDEYLSSLVSISPNPVNDFFTVRLTDIPTNSLTIQLVDVVGRTIFQRKSDTYNLKNEFDIDGSSLPDGLYSLRIDTEIGTISKKIIVVHP